MAVFPPLREEVRRLGDGETTPELSARRDSLELAIEEAGRRVEERFGHTDLDPRLAESLLTLARAHIEADRLGQRCPPDRLAAVVVQAQRALERSFRLLRDQYPHADWRVLADHDRQHNANLFEGVARSFGFATPLPERLVGVRKGKVRHAVEAGTATLRPLILAALLAARTAADHPMRRVAKRDPQLLCRLDALATLRDTAAAHDSDRTLALRDVGTQVETVYDTLLLLNCTGPLHISTAAHEVVAHG
jgi:hypothetical protein